MGSYSLQKRPIYTLLGKYTTENSFLQKFLLFLRLFYFFIYKHKADVQAKGIEPQIVVSQEHSYFTTFINISQKVCQEPNGFMEFCDSPMFARSQMVKKSVFLFSTFHSMKQKVIVFKNNLLNHVCKLSKKQQPESFNVKNKTMQFLSVPQIVLLVRFIWRDHVHIVRI